MPDTEYSAPLTFDRVARDYERTRPISAEIADLVARHITAQISPDEWILDAGCGTGRFTRSLAQHHPRTVGTDVSEAMLEELRRLCDLSQQACPETVVADLRSLPFPNSHFATVVTVHVLHLIPDWQQALQEIWRVLAPGGHLFLGYEDRTPSEVREFYMREGRRRGLLPEHPGAQNTSRDILPILQNRLGGVRHTETAPAAWAWTRMVSVQEMLDDLSARLYSPQWGIPEDEHQTLLALTTAHAITTFGALDTDPQEEQTVQFVLHAIQKPRTAAALSSRVAYPSSLSNR